MKSNNLQTLTRKGFEGKVENALLTTMENADLKQYNSLQEDYRRRGEGNFDAFLAQEKERILQNDGFKKFDFWKQNGFPNIQDVSFLVAQEIEEKSNGNVDWQSHWLKSEWKEKDLVRDYFKGMGLEGTLWATNDFRNRVFNFTFEDWKNGKWPIPEQPMVGQHTYRYGNHYRVCTLSMGEYEKIVEAQKSILQKLIDLFLKGLTDDFNHRFTNSEKEEMLVDSEKKKVQEWLSNKDLSGACA